MRLEEDSSLRPELIFGAITLAFDQDGLGVVQEPVEDGGGDAAVVVENLLCRRSSAGRMAY